MLPLAAQTSSVAGSDHRRASLPPFPKPSSPRPIRALPPSARRSATPPAATASADCRPEPTRSSSKSRASARDAAEIELQINTPATLNVQLELGQVTETVNVRPKPWPSTRRTPSVGNPFTETQIKETPPADAQRGRAPQRPARRIVRPARCWAPGRPEQRDCWTASTSTTTRAPTASTPFCPFRSIRCRSSAPRSRDWAPTWAAPPAVRSPSSPRAAPISSTVRLRVQSQHPTPRPTDWFSNRAGVARSAAGPQPVRRFPRRPDPQESRLFLLQLRRPQRSQRQFQDRHRSHRAPSPQGIVQVLLKDGRTVNSDSARTSPTSTRCTSAPVPTCSI